MFTSHDWERFEYYLYRNGDDWGMVYDIVFYPYYTLFDGSQIMVDPQNHGVQNQHAIVFG